MELRLPMRRGMVSGEVDQDWDKVAHRAGYAIIQMTKIAVAKKLILATVQRIQRVWAFETAPG